MRAWEVAEPGPIEKGPLRLVERPVPAPGPDELLVRVLACGVCRTDLHVSEGDLPVHRPHVVPGHEVVGTVAAAGSLVRGFPPGTPVGVAWLRRTDGDCVHCRRGAENLCPRSEYTGWDADGGYAEFTTVPADFAYRLPIDPASGADPADFAPLLCAGIIGYRALRRASLPPGGRLGLYGFGGSAHLCAQLALAEGAEVHVLTRGEAARRLALELGAASARGAYDRPPVPLDAAVLFAPVGELVPVALQALDRGGVLCVAGIHLSDLPPLVYQRDLFYERELRSVTSNTRADGRAFLELAARYGVRATVHRYPLAEAQQALRDLKAGRFDGAAVLDCA
ncbi:zinc-binding alcohol dehydrogenase family protein [Phaeacidiphilus oryzae]|uniref:zinc-binding alcohol dehydrogenase family protein n=1 Tax=Phaeacidiphilus oryzae TaxID=348818 RepID=UPI00056CFA70|nr:zinc-binding alcohol dehydrogenase family protein [Phaeacidiphilus oryzae]